MGALLGAAIALRVVDSGAETKALISAEPELSKPETSLAELERQRSALLAEIERLQTERGRLEFDRVDEVPAIASLPLELGESQLRRLRKEWIEASLQPNEESRFSRRSEREQSRLIESLGLTVDQASQLALLMDQREQQRRLAMLRAMGVLNDEEYDSFFSELGSFDFDLALTNMLSPEQLAARESIEAQQREQGVERITQAMVNRLGIAEEERFSESERSAIQQSIRLALESNTELLVPPAIEDLPIHDLNKRILSAGFQQLDPATFEKLYESIVEASENGRATPGGMGRRRTERPAP